MKHGYRKQDGCFISIRGDCSPRIKERGTEDNEGNEDGSNNWNPTADGTTIGNNDWQRGVCPLRLLRYLLFDGNRVHLLGPFSLRQWLLPDNVIFIRVQSVFHPWLGYFRKRLGLE